MRTLGPASLLTAVVLAAGARPVAGQSFTGVGPAAPSPCRPRPSRRGPAGPAPPKAPAREGVVLRHLHSTLQGYRLTGEIAASEWPIYLTEAQAQSRVGFRIGYLSAVSVAPEASTLTVLINGRSVGEVRLHAPNAVKVVEFEVPDGLLRTGFNAVRLAAEQRHRVDCSPEASYELWTQIDPSQTGLVLPEAAAGFTQLGDLPALWPDADGALPIRAVTGRKTRPATLERVIRAAQALTLAGRFEQPIVDLGAPAMGGAGVNLVVGTAAEIAALGEVGPIGSVAGPMAFVLPPAAGRRARSSRPAPPTRRSTRPSASSRPRGSSPGGRPGPARRGRVPGLPPGRRRARALRDLGLVSQEFSGHFFRIGFNVILPPDFLPADYGKVMLDLAGGYAPGLTKEAQVVVSINGRSVASSAAAQVHRRRFRQNQIPLPLGHWRPGLNRVEIGAQVPVASDAVCDPLATIAARKRFLFLDSTEIVLPPLARIARMPNLSVTASGGMPFTAGRGRPKLFVPMPDRDTVGAAATLAARIAVSAGRPIDFELTTARPADGSGATLVVAPARALDPAMMASAGLDPGLVRAAWQERAEAAPDKGSGTAFSRAEIAVRNRLLLQRDVPPLCRLPRWGGHGLTALPETTGGRLPARTGIDQTAGSRDLLDQWTDSVRGRGWSLAGLSRLVGDAGDWTRSTAEASWSWATDRLQTAPAPAGLDARSSLVVAQAIHGDSPDDVTTIVTAPNAAMIGAAVACLADPRVWTQIDGRLSTLDASDGVVAHRDAEDVRYIPTGPLSIQNVRLIAAGWLSLNPTFYVLFALMIAVFLSATTRNLVRNLGRRQD